MAMRTGRHRRNKAGGFSLIELMIVVAILAIIVAVALPSYQNQIKKTRRATAKADLVELASFMQRFYSENYKFDQDKGGTAVSLPYNQSPKDGTSKSYTIALAKTAVSYTLTATPSGAQVGDTCGNLTITHTGVKGAGGTNCW